MALDLLIVDNSVAIRKMLQRVLRQADFQLGQVYEAADGIEALAVLHGSRVDLVLTDINMPKMDGLELLGKIKTEDRLKQVPVVIVTTEGRQAKVMAAAELGASGYVRKPFTPEQLRKTLDFLRQ